MSTPTHVALLRGINVGGQNRVPMAELRAVVAGLGFDPVATYIQSGNVVLGTRLAEASIVETLERGIEARFGFPVPVVVRAANELAAVAASHPLSGFVDDPKLLHVAFLASVPDRPIDAVIDASEHEPDRFVGIGREVYLAYPNGSGRSKLSHTLLERRLGVRVTARNWRTVLKLKEMAGATA